MSRHNFMAHQLIAGCVVEIPANFPSVQAIDKAERERERERKAATCCGFIILPGTGVTRTMRGYLRFYGRTPENGCIQMYSENANQAGSGTGTGPLPPSLSLSVPF